MVKDKSGRNKSFLLLMLVVVLLLCAFVLSSLPQQPNWEISNLSKKKSVRTYMEVADTALSKMRGLMFRDRIIAILFKFDSDGKWAIHSNFVKAPFDAVYLSGDGEVVEVFRKIPPNTALVSPKKDARYLLELPVETFDRLSIGVGDRLEWKNR